jgi:hypothetical protein
VIVIVISLLIMLASLGGIAFTVVNGGGLTVDTLFFTLILLLIFLMFAGTAWYELRSWLARRSRPAAVVAATGASSASTATPAGRPAKQKLGSVSADIPLPRPMERAVRPAPPKPVSIEGLSVGSILVAETAAAADTLVESKPYATGWRLLSCASVAELERRLHNSGRELFFLVGSTEASAFALERKAAVIKALAAVLSTVRAEGRNAVEISAIRAVNLLGVHYVTITAKPRHVQEQPVLLEPAQRPRLLDSSSRTLAEEKQKQQRPLEPTRAA